MQVERACHQSRVPSRQNIPFYPIRCIPLIKRRRIKRCSPVIPVANPLAYKYARAVREKLAPANDGFIPPVSCEYLSSASVINGWDPRNACVPLPKSRLVPFCPDGPISQEAGYPEPVPPASLLLLKIYVYHQMKI